MRPRSASTALAQSTTSSNSSAPIPAARFASPRGQMANRLGIVAGGGGLPRRLVETCRAAGRDVFVLALEGAAEPDTVRDVPHAWCRIGAAAAGLSLLRENNVTELVLAGSIRRPSLATLRPDWRAAKLFARIGYRALGDDGLLSAVVEELELEGVRVIGADQLTIGVQTVALAAEPGLRGIAFEAHTTIVLDRDAVACAADRAGLFVVG